MSIKAILFDLDGTLLPMDQDKFVRAYIGGLAAAAAKRGFNPEKMASAVMAGTAAMFKNDGSVTNEECFWRAACGVVGDKIREETELFDDFYREEFDKLSVTCGNTPEARKIIDLIHARGFRVALATNPLFPAVATAKRIRWAGLKSEDFELVTSYEGSHFTKPNPDYYREVLSVLGLSPEECVMVGNDVDEDMIAKALGMKVFLLTNELINRSGTDIDDFPHGGFGELAEFIENLGKAQAEM